MADLSTTYMGLSLRNPLIAASSGLTSDLERLKELEQHGIAAVVLKSLFEEQIRFEVNQVMQAPEYGNYYPEADDYINNYSREHSIEQYLSLIRAAKESLSIPVIASINCISATEWISFAKKIESSGADALELNIFVLPSDPNQSGEQNENTYLEIIQKVRKQIRIPLAIKLSYYFSSVAKTALKLSWTGIDGMVLFNRFFSPDIDIENFKVTATNVFSHAEDLSVSLRWVAMLSDRVHCDIAASTGIHDGKAVIKQLLAGAKAVQLASVLYKDGFGSIEKMLKELEEWMEHKSFSRISDFNGMMSIRKANNPAAYERVQFMKHFAGIE